MSLEHKNQGRILDLGPKSLAAAVAMFAIVALASPLASPRPPPTRSAVTFSKDIAPILQRSCQRCHQPDSVAPMSLLTYDQVRPYAKSIVKRTHMGPVMGVMPPWYIEKNIGIQQYKEDPSLTEVELAKIEQWVAAGAPEGNPADLPPPIKLNDGPPSGRSASRTSSPCSAT